MKFGEYARELREKKGISLRSLAKSLGWSAAFLSDVERGNRRVPKKWDKIHLWCAILEADGNEFCNMAALDVARPCTDCPLKK